MTAGRTLPDLTAEQQLSNLQKEYDLVNSNFRQLADIRFKLLGFVPFVGGAANALLIQNALFPGKEKAPNYPLALLVGTVGFLVTFAIVMYDQRNSQFYNALIGRAKYLEARLGFPNARERDQSGGQFTERPTNRRRMLGLFPAKHDSALALIYASVLGLWFFTFVYAALGALGTLQVKTAEMYAGISAGVVGLIFWIDLLRLDRTWQKLWEKLWP
jgi:hypothetical protein